ncbi:MAG: MOSC domain-containing protein [Acidobacteria bacterium]|nr:MOSC domain-containing protein [Acidobacteriota bacterium]
MNKGTLLGIWAREEWGGEMRLLDSASLTAGKGMAEDVSFGSRRQVTIIEEDVWNSVMAQLKSDLPPQTRRANLMVSGIKLKETRGKILNIGECRIEILGESAPCASMDKKLPGLKDALKPDWNGGAFGSVLDGGKINIGDKVYWEET